MDVKMEPADDVNCQDQTSFQCSLCSDAFGNRRQLNRHLRAFHSKPAAAEFACPYCPRVLRRKDHYEFHLESHDPKKRYACTHCSCAYQHLSSLRRHIKTSHTASENSELSSPKAEETPRHGAKLSRASPPINVERQLFTQPPMSNPQMNMQMSMPQMGMPQMGMMPVGQQVGFPNMSMSYMNVPMAQFQGQAFPGAAPVGYPMMMAPGMGPMMPMPYPYFQSQGSFAPGPPQTATSQYFK